MSAHTATAPSVRDIARDAQPAAFQAVEEAVQQDRVAHAWLFNGAEGVGQFHLAAALSKAMNCPDTSGGRGCENCDTCRRIDHGAHPTLVTFEPEGREHRVDDVRELWLSRSSRTPSEGRRQVLRIVAADRINESAQNAFLKALEEPPPSTVWVLEVADDRQLLETITSRCRTVHMKPWSDRDLDRYVTATLGADADIASAERRALVRLAGGSPTRLDALLAADVRAARATLGNVVLELSTRGPGAALSMGEHFSGLAHAREAAVIEANEALFAEMDDQYGGSSARGRGWPPGEKNRIQQLHKRQAREANTSAMQLALELHASLIRDVLACVSNTETRQSLRTSPAPAITNVDMIEAIETGAKVMTVDAALEILDLCDEGTEMIARNVNQKAIVRQILVRTAMAMAGA